MMTMNRWWLFIAVADTSPRLVVDIDAFIPLHCKVSKHCQCLRCVAKTDRSLLSHSYQLSSVVDAATVTIQYTRASILFARFIYFFVIYSPLMI